MQEIPCVLTEWQELNSLLYAPLSATKRVQYTCITVSANFIALGATSGSVYLFTRDPCVFQQLIPLSEGAIFRAQISPDEKTIAFATVRGSICLVSLKPSIKLITVSTEHVGEKVTCLCWNDNSTEVYAGDELGKISVIVLPSFTVNGMFQAPSGALMDLDSKIVQISFYSSILLISTLSRCYICDTVFEQYKQIGNKPRDGEFGACFLRTHNTVDRADEINKQDYVRQQVYSVNEELDNEFDAEEYLPKIYCARPGTRLWEVLATGVVIKTHQFKEALAIAPIPVYKPSIGKLFKFKNQEETWPAQSINLAQLFVICNKYLFSYTTNGLYVLDPENAQVVLWNDEFPDIFMAHIIGDTIYLMTSSGVFHCLTLAFIESLILKLYDKKLHKECFEMCQILRPQLISSVIDESCNIDSEENTEAPKILVPIISLIKSNQNTQPIKLESGIVLVNAGDKFPTKDSTSFSDKRLEVTENLDDLEDLFTSLNTNGTSRVSATHTKSGWKRLENGESEVRNGSHNETDNIEEDMITKTELDYVSPLQKTICNVQEELETLFTSISSQMNHNMNEKQLEEVINLFVNTLDSLKKKYEVSNELQNYLYEVIHSAEIHYCNSLLENLPLELLHKIQNHKILEQLVNIFIEVNSSKNIECCCGLSYPVFGTGSGKSVEPKFFDIGKVLLERLSLVGSNNLCLRICNQIPCMWRDYLLCKGYTKQRVPDTLLKQCLQSRDNWVLSMILISLDEQQWKLAAKCFESIKIGRCVKCGNPYEINQIPSREFYIDWPGIIHLIIKKHGPKNAMSFLSKIQDNLPEVVFDKSVYQSIIFSTILNQHGVNHAVELDHSMEHNSICSPKVLQPVVQMVEKDLGEPVNKDSFGFGPHHWGMRYNLASSTCPCCTLSLQTPVLLGNNGISLFPCGHAYHVSCMIQKKISRCNLHPQQ